MLLDYMPVVFLMVVGILVGIVPQLINYLVSPNQPSFEKLTPYECGIDPVGSTYCRNFIPYYIYGLLFLLFEVEVLFFFLWAIIYRDMMLFAFIEISFFAFILFLGLIYAWRKGALDWAAPNMR